MYEKFQSFGDIDDVFIPSKRDIRGMHYGFVRFFEVKYEDNLALKLSNIIIRSRKIFVNVPQFQRSNPQKVESSGRGQNIQSGSEVNGIKHLC